VRAASRPYLREKNRISHAPNGLPTVVPPVDPVLLLTHDTGHSVGTSQRGFDLQLLSRGHHVGVASHLAGTRQMLDLCDELVPDRRWTLDQFDVGCGTPKLRRHRRCG